MQTEALIIVLELAIVFVPIWVFISAYRKRGEEIRALREEVEKLKKKDRDDGD